ncbi:MAG: hypothetical protein V1779_16165 [bacterium]
MKRLILILLLAITILSCREIYDEIKEWQINYISKILNNPENIYEIISTWNNSGTFQTISSKNFVIQDSLKQYIDYVKKIKSYGYTIKILDPWMFREANSRKVHFCNEILVKAKNYDLYMVFRFQTERNKFNLVKIDTNKSSIYKGKRDLSLRDTVLKENERFVDLMCKNPEQLISVIDNSDYFSEICRKINMPDDSLKFYSRHLKILIEFGYEIYNRNTFYFSDARNVTGGIPLGIDDEIVIKGKGKELYISLLFVSENDKVVLANMFNDKRTLTQQVSEFKYPNE